ncbi:hypothetical protein K8I85_11690 [bacterium]|nr:hypothetical protein [bacterium]
MSAAITRCNPRRSCTRPTSSSWSANRSAGRAGSTSWPSPRKRCAISSWTRPAGAPKHGGDLKRISLTASALPADEPAWEILALHRALEKLATHSERMARIVELRVFAGCPAAEAAELLGISKRTADSDWKTARLWLAREMSS